MCLSDKKKKNKINCFEQSRFSVLALAEVGASKAAVGFRVSLSRTFMRLPHSVDVGHVALSQKWGGEGRSFFLSPQGAGFVA